MHKNSFVFFLIYYFVFVLTGTLHAESISVLYFDNNTGAAQYQWASKGITDMLTSDLSAVADLNLVERENLNKILKEQSLSQTGITEGKGLEIGRLLFAEKLIMGSYAVAGKKLRIDARITDTQTGKVIHSASIEGFFENIFDLEKQLAGKIIDSLGKKRPEGLDNKETQSVDAAAAYYQGLDLLDSGKAKEALTKFQESSEKDPTYSKPMQSMEESYSFLNDFKKKRQQREISELYKKMDAFKRKLSGKIWITYPQWLQKNSNLDPKTSSEYMNTADGQALMLCDTPARCVWHLMMTRIEAGDKLEEYFSDTRKKEFLLKENLKDGLRAEKSFQGDPALPEALYIEILTLHMLGEKEAIRSKAPEFMKKYPDYRLIEFVEDWYEESIRENK